MKNSKLDKHKASLVFLNDESLKCGAYVYYIELNNSQGLFDYDISEGYVSDIDISISSCGEIGMVYSFDSEYHPFNNKACGSLVFHTRSECKEAIITLKERKIDELERTLVNLKENKYNT